VKDLKSHKCLLNIHKGVEVAKMVAGIGSHEPQSDKVVVT
jgi:hypothetical protein